MHKKPPFYHLLILVKTMTIGLSIPLSGQSTACPDPNLTISTPGTSLGHIQYLSSDELQGRQIGSPGAYCAAQYLSDQFKALGLEGGTMEDGYFQVFDIRAGSSLGVTNSFKVSGNDEFTLGSEWIPLGYSASIAIAAPLHYEQKNLIQVDSSVPRAKQDIIGKIVVVDETALQQSSPFPLILDYYQQARVAANQKAAGIVFIINSNKNLPRLDQEIRTSLNIPVLAIYEEAASHLRSLALRKATAVMEISVRPKIVTARNVVGLIPGENPTFCNNRTVVIGAHYDHLGLGGEGSLAPDASGDVHNGADDNASGSSGLLEVARKLTIDSHRPSCTVVLVAFTGEERGLWGSSHYVRNAPHINDQTIAMLNLDMIGRLDGDPLTIMGVGTAAEWPDLIVTSNKKLLSPLSIITSPDGFGPSDHSSFYGEGIPVLHFFSNTHEDYHRPSDDWEKIDSQGLDQVVSLVTEVTLALAGKDGHSLPIPLTPIKIDRHSQPSTATNGGYGPYLGTIPDMVPKDFGLRLTGVREGSPADIAGLKKDDVVILFAQLPIADIYAYTYALRDHNPGDTVEIVVLRDNQEVTVTVTLGARR
jgi:aminopeptidase YwaD